MDETDRHREFMGELKVFFYKLPYTVLREAPPKSGQVTILFVVKWEAEVENVLGVQPFLNK